jgi:hypothetical protein
MVNADTPTNNLPSKDVNNGSEVIPPAQTPQVGKVTGPYMVRVDGHNAIFLQNIPWSWPNTVMLLVVPLVW